MTISTAREDSVPVQRQGSAQPAKSGSLAARAYVVQQALAQLPGDVHALRDIARLAKLPEATTHRILQDGVDKHIFEQVGRGMYRLGTGTARAGVQAMNRLPGATGTHTYLVRLHQATGGLALLYVLSAFGGAKRLCTDYEIGGMDPAEVGMTAEDVVSVSRSLRTGASGRAILAYLPQDARDQVLAEEVPPTAGPGVIRDNQQLTDSLLVIRERGYAIGRQECMAGWDSVAAPVFWRSQVMGSVLLLKPTSTMPEDLRPLIHHTLRAAKDISDLTATPVSAVL
ncbi:IclR family transcriptional regulator C-terminal domain-containing protein [Kitasatospora purpeofusca]|uniref:IclR family transcriptional regulator n=1 Tax=Kitasatospora purpeofusca TaxID=67352 RepID=UPI0033EA7350